MSPRRVVAWIGLAAFVLSWFLHGWMACWIALSMLWNPEARLERIPPIYAACSALTNVVMVVALGGTVRSIDIGPRWAWSLILAGVLNTWWLVAFRGNISGFSFAYYPWLLSFFAVGWAALPGRTSGMRPPGEGSGSGG